MFGVGFGVLCFAFGGWVGVFIQVLVWLRGSYKDLNGSSDLRKLRWGAFSSL